MLSAGVVPRPFQNQPLISSKLFLMISTRNRTIWTIFCLIFLTRVFLSQAKVIGMVGWGEADDGLFLEHASSILTGNWLGEYSNMTLTKGPGYPIFIAANYSMGIPLPLGEEILLLASYVAFSLAMAKVLRVWWMSIPMFLVLAFLPISTGIATDRVLRDTFYAALTFLTLASLLRIVDPDEKDRLLAWPVCGGISAALFQATREEAIWILPAVVVILAIPAYRMLVERRWIMGPLRRLAGMAGVAVCVLLAISGLNYAHYRIFAINDFRSGSFAKAYGALQRIEQEQPISFVPVPAATRRLAYGASSTFARLEPLLENPIFWRAPTCEHHPDRCGEIGGGWFFWAIRDAASRVGAYESAEKAGAFWSAVSNEINAACEQGKLRCGRASASLALPIGRWDWSLIAEKIGNSLRFFATDEIEQVQMASKGVADRLDFVEHLVGKRVAKFPGEERPVKVAGWVAAPADARIDVFLDAPDRPFLQVIKRAVRISPPRQTANAVYPVHEFSIIDECGKACTLNIAVNGVRVFSGKATEPAERVSAVGDPSILSSISAVVVEPEGDHFFETDRGLKIAVLSEIAKFHAGIRLPGTLVALALFVVLTATGSLSMTQFLVVSAIGGAAVTRIALLGFLSGTSFPAIGTYYMLPAYPLMTAATVAVLVLGLARLRRLSGSRGFPVRGLWRAGRMREEASVSAGS